jgi:hypothetical protein
MNPSIVEIRNPKHEIRNKFEEPNPKLVIAAGLGRVVGWTFLFRHGTLADGQECPSYLAFVTFLIFEFISDFEFRISCLQRPHRALMVLRASLAALTVMRFLFLLAASKAGMLAFVPINFKIRQASL